MKTNVKFVFTPNDPIFSICMQKEWKFDILDLLIRIKDISFSKAADWYNPESRPSELPFYVSFTNLYHLVETWLHILFSELVMIGFFTKIIIIALFS